MVEGSADHVDRALAGRCILVTGGSGYVAAALGRRLEHVDCRLVRLTRHPERVAPGGLQGEVRERDFGSFTVEDWRAELEGVDIVLHFGAQTSAPVANRDPLADVQANLVPAVRLFEACRALGAAAPFVLSAGSVTSYGFVQHQPVAEDTRDQPLTVYCLHKVVVEQYAELYARLGWARAAVMRLANVYGPGPKSSSADRGILNQMVRKALAGEALTIYGEGRELRDYVYVGDVVDAFLAAATHLETTNGRHFIVASGVGTPLGEAFALVAARVEAATGRHVEVRHIAPPAGSSSLDARHFTGDISALRAATGWSPRVDLREGIDRTIAAELTQ